MTRGAASSAAPCERKWTPVDIREYRTSLSLTAQEEAILAELLRSSRRWGEGRRDEVLGKVCRLADPLRDAMARIDGDEYSKDSALAAVLRSCGREKTSFWGWSLETWTRVLGPDQAEFFKVNGPLVDGGARQYMAAAG